VAIVPCALALWLWLRARHLTVLAAHAELKAAHVEHAEKLNKLLDKLDSESPGGIAEVLDQLDTTTPGGLQVIRAKLDTLRDTQASQSNTSAQTVRALREHGAKLDKHSVV
jgi:hypothetical protein